MNVYFNYNLFQFTFGKSSYVSTVTFWNNFHLICCIHCLLHYMLKLSLIKEVAGSMFYRDYHLNLSHEKDWFVMGSIKKILKRDLFIHFTSFYGLSAFHINRIVIFYVWKDSWYGLAQSHHITYPFNSLETLTYVDCISAGLILFHVQDDKGHFIRYLICLSS